MKSRLLLGPVMIAALIALLWADEWVSRQAAPGWLLRILPGAGTTLPPGLAILLVGLLIVPLASRELGAIFHANGVLASRRMMTLAAMGGLLVSAAIPLKSSPLHAVALVSSAGAAVLVGALAWHIRDKTLNGASAAVGAAMLSFIYLGLMFGFILAIRREHSAWVVAGVLVVVKSCDIGAFFTGKSIGRHKLIPWLSPGKTWEGLIGGVVLSALVAWGGVMLARAYLGPEESVSRMPAWLALLSGAILGLVGQVGDLLESVLKRDAGLKDSGRSVPGFGGVLDVLDSILLAAPVAFWLLTLTQIA